MLGIKRYRIRKSKDVSKHGTELPEDDHLYLQREAELEAEELKKFELHAEQRQFEVEGDNDICEMSTSANTHRLELRGEEHSKQLE